MPSLSMPSVCALVFTLALALAAPLLGQDSAVKPARTTGSVHWRKYVNKELGVSFWYPKRFRPVKDEVGCGCLLYLKERGNQDASIVVTIIAEPTFEHIGSGGSDLVRQRIGDHDFYCGLGGSMGTHFTDECTFRLKDKALEFNFTPDSSPNVGWKSDSLASRVLKTLRTF